MKKVADLGTVNVNAFKNAPNVWFENGAMFIATASGRKRIEIQATPVTAPKATMEWPETR